MESREQEIKATKLGSQPRWLPSLKNSPRTHLPDYIDFRFIENFGAIDLCDAEHCNNSRNPNGDASTGAAPGPKREPTQRPPNHEGGRTAGFPPELRTVNEPPAIGRDLRPLDDEIQLSQALHHLTKPTWHACHPTFQRCSEKLTEFGAREPIAPPPASLDGWRCPR